MRSSIPFLFVRVAREHEKVGKPFRLDCNRAGLIDPNMSRGAFRRSFLGVQEDCQPSRYCLQFSRRLKLGKNLGSGIRQLITIVDYSTFRCWVYKEQGRKPKLCKGRPRIDKVVRELVVQMAKDTGWGCSRILGEFRKLGVGSIAQQSVKSILVEHGIEPGPKRGPGTWRKILKIHSDTPLQVDSFSKRIWTKQGPRQVFALAFIHLASRKVFVTSATCRPDAAWMKTQAHAFLRYANREQLGCAMVMRDRDGKYSSAFDSVFTDRSIRVKPVGPQAPNLNAFIERWIQSVKHEALDNFIVLGIAHFDYIVREFVAYYHACRPHQGIGIG